MPVPNYNLIVPKLNCNTSFTSSIGNAGIYSNFANFNTFGGQSGLNFNTSLPFSLRSNVSTPIVKTETWEERQERIAKEYEKKQSEYKKLQDEIKRLENDEAIVAAKELVQRAEKATVDEASGTLIEKETVETYKKQPFWKKALRAAGNMVNGVFKLATDFVGYETNPKTGERKINWKKCLKNVGIAAGCIALTFIPYVGPYISAALLATGVVSGAIGVGKGIHKLNKTKRNKNASTEDIDKAFQEIGSGAFIGISSAVGLRGLGKGLSASHTGASVSRSMGKNAASQFVKDATVNAFKATKQTALAQKASVMDPNIGFWKTFGNNLPKFGKRGFEKSLKDVNKQIENQIQDINKAILDRSKTGLDCNILELERTKLADLQSKINSSSMSKTDWQAFAAKDNPLKVSSQKLRKLRVGDTFKVGNTDICVTEANHGIINEVAANLDNFANQAANLAQTRNSSMKLMAWNKNHAGEVETYTGTPKITCRGRYWDLIKPAQGNTKLGTSWNYVKAGVGALLNNVLGITFKPWNMVQKSPGSAWFKFESTVLNPTYERGMLNGMLGMGDAPIVLGADENGKPIYATKASIEEINKQIAQNEATIKSKKNELEKQQKEIYA